MALLEFSITPLGAGESVSQYVARCVDLIDKSGLDYRLHAMGTVVEGDLDHCSTCSSGAIEAVAADCDRVSVSAKLDYRKGHTGALDGQSGQRREEAGASRQEIARTRAADLAALAAGSQCLVSRDASLGTIIRVSLDCPLGRSSVEVRSL